MDGVHDMGGTDGFDPVTPVEHPYFTADWERRAFVMLPSLVGQDVINMHEFRHGVERMGGVRYLSTPYYEHWLAAFERLLVEKGVVSAAAVERRLDAALGDGDLDLSGGDPDAAAVTATIEDGHVSERGVDDPAFEAGDRVQVRNEHPKGHTRCPDYLRRASGTVDAVHGAFVLPDANAHGREVVDPLYAVRFDPEELWGPDAERNEAIYADLWERYLEAPA